VLSSAGQRDITLKRWRPQKELDYLTFVRASIAVWHPLPPRQQAVLEIIQAFWQEHGVAPSLADARALGVSRQTIHEHFRALQRKGLLDNLEGTGLSSQRPLGRERC